jgi:hypothetical protein
MTVNADRASRAISGENRETKRESFAFALTS